jgi:hypothetical protein
MDCFASLAMTGLDLAMLSVIAREGGRSSIPEPAVIETIGFGVLDRPIKSGDDELGMVLEN